MFFIPLFSGTYFSLRGFREAGFSVFDIPGFRGFIKLLPIAQIMRSKVFVLVQLSDGLFLNSINGTNYYVFFMPVLSIFFAIIGVFSK